MAKSLQEQLIAAGLVNKKRAQKLDLDKRRQDKAKRQLGKKAQAPSEQELLAKKEREEKMARDKEANRQRDLARAQRAVAAEIADLIATHKLDRRKGEISHQFVHKRTVKKLFVTAEQQQGLIKGSLVVVKGAKRYELVPAEVGDKIAARNKSAVIRIARDAAQTPVDEHYEKFEIPDDLMW